ncbi:hypothetical protein H8958_019110 [Nasalis larvatus]|uniref:uncharacterized protein LOC104660844 isoform X1 n=1 Tax=Rhinopithecus roxellana TaxID=61622 RepID=UPI0005334049|nr:uncharacterized protein LOC104660844 isoform X1 [Rhinopithecus roxellana]
MASPCILFRPGCSIPAKPRDSLNLIATFPRSHDMSLQLEAFQGWPRRPQRPDVACKGREELFSRKDPKGSKAKGAICFSADSEDKEEKCPVSPILLVLIFQ